MKTKLLVIGGLAVGVWVQAARAGDYGDCYSGRYSVEDAQSLSILLDQQRWQAAQARREVQFAEWGADLRAREAEIDANYRANMEGMYRDAAGRR